ncbi:Uma2 family endonuclease [Neorhodopirellula pilleata]|uniref:Putative restriction endonuclease domain-containing protein n=1 Tax=Neorhodopirellula pilleata TaxID=2714738 RepID=A0A5C5ZQE0_9BACT|nr:Uma2 family endonuclease [Neorhodopirellula pilleata]TWT89268.1 hypothetical protein Pla100_55850 [Neorhodopirellula pilleata]
MTTIHSIVGVGEVPEPSLPVTLPLTVKQFADLVDRGHFEKQPGQIELINGRIVRMNPQGPQHASPLDILAEWCVERSARRFWIRIEKPIETPSHSSTPEPDIAWVRRQSYAHRHPQPEDISLLIEASVSSHAFDLGEKRELYASASIPEYWQIDVPQHEIRVHRDPSGTLYRDVSTPGEEATISPICLPSAMLRISDWFESKTQ